MTYEEKLNLILNAIIEAQKASRTGSPATLRYRNADNELDKLNSQELHDILLKLQDEKILTVRQITNRLLPLNEQPKDPGYFYIDILEGFDDWYENYLIQQKTNIENLDYINILRVYDVVLDINEQIQLTHKTTIHLPLIPSVIRFRTLFPMDTIGIRDEYCQNRLNSIKYLKEKGVINDFSHGRNGWDTIVSISFRLSELLKANMTDFISRSENNFQVLIHNWQCYRKQKITTMLRLNTC